MTLGALIRSTRTKRGMTLDEVAAVTGASKSTLSRVERGILEPGIGLCVQLSVLLRLPIGKMVTTMKET